jgi:hypothetical protein
VSDDKFCTGCHRDTTHQPHSDSCTLYGTWAYVARVQREDKARRLAEGFQLGITNTVAALESQRLKDKEKR